jgi:hypothetical protein
VLQVQVLHQSLGAACSKAGKGKGTDWAAMAQPEPTAVKQQERASLVCFMGVSRPIHAKQQR